MTRIPWWSYAILLSPRTIAANLERVERAGLVERAPNLWQLSLGVLRMWHRVLFRNDTVGTCTDYPPRPTWRARLLEKKAIRLPFLLGERAVAPLDLTGLASPPERIMRHLMGAHHDGNQFIFDLEILSCHPGKLEALHAQVCELLERDTRRARWLRDLAVYERYHENLEAAVAAALAHGVQVTDDEARDPDLSFGAYMRWCAAQPASPRETLAALRAGRYSLEHGVSR